MKAAVVFEKPAYRRQGRKGKRFDLHDCIKSLSDLLRFAERYYLVKLF